MNNRRRLAAVFAITLLTSIVCLASLLWVKNYAPSLYSLYSLQISILPALAYLLLGLPEYIVSLSGTLKLDGSFVHSLQSTFFISFAAAILLYLGFSLVPASSLVLRYAILDSAFLVIPLNIIFVIRSYVEANGSLIAAQLFRSVYALSCYVAPVIGIFLLKDHGNYLIPTFSRGLLVFFFIVLVFSSYGDINSLLSKNLSPLFNFFPLQKNLGQFSRGFLINFVWIIYTFQVLLIKFVVITFGQSLAPSLLFGFDICLRASIVYGTLGVYTFPLLSRAVNSQDETCQLYPYFRFNQLLAKTLLGYFCVILPFLFGSIFALLIYPASVLNISGIDISGGAVFAMSLCVLFAGLRSLVLRPLFLLGSSPLIVLTSFGDLVLSLILALMALHFKTFNVYGVFESFFVMISLSSAVFFGLDLWLISQRVTDPLFFRNRL